MRRSLKCGLFMVLFSSFVFVYLSLPYLTPPIIIVPDGLIYGKDRAPAYRENNYMNMGELLVKIGFSADDEIQWALSQKKKMLEEILKEKKLMI